MLKISVCNPTFIVQRESCQGSGKMNMQVAFEVSAKRMYCKINAGNEALLLSLYFNYIGCDRCDFIDKMSIVPENVPKHIGHGESDVLPACLR